MNAIFEFRGIALPCLLVIFIAGNAWGGPGDGKERTGQLASPKAVQVRSAPISFPLRVVGTATYPPKKSVLIVVLGEQFKPVNSLKVNEGETVEGYRVVRVHMDQVTFERDGQTFEVAVWNERAPVANQRAPARIIPDVPYVSTKEQSAKFISPPANMEEISKGTEVFFERLQQNPEFRNMLEEARPLIRQRLEASGANR